MTDKRSYDDYGDIWEFEAPVKPQRDQNINVDALKAYRAGCDLQEAGQVQAALNAFMRAVQHDPKLVNAHLRIARLTDNDAVRRRHLLAVLEIEPNNVDARRGLALSEGSLTPEEAAELYNVAEVKRAAGDVAASSEILLCPVCKGHMTLDEPSGRVQCRFCGYIQAFGKQAAGREDLQTALAAQRASTRWIVGGRLLHCNACAAEWTLAPNILSTECHFCGSTHVIQADTVKSFRQPDGIVPFALTEQQARDRILMALERRAEKLKNIWDSNRVRGGTMRGVYLPFWVFTDAQPQNIQSYVHVVLTKREPKPDAERDLIQDRHAAFDVAICAVKSPPEALTNKLGIYNLKYLQAYQPKLLAKYPAEVYNVDFASASLRARGIVSQAIRKMYPDDPVRANLARRMQVIDEFMLLLLPVWVVTLTERDGDQRSALVNGQTGQVVFGETRKRES